VPGATDTVASSINSNGEVVGTYQDALTNSHGFIYSAGGFTTLDVPSATSTYISRNNANGQLIGTYLDSLGVHAFIATPVVDTPVTKPTCIKDCKKGRWKKFGFKNQGLCEKYVNNLD